MREHKQASIWSNLNTDWQDIYGGDHGTVPTVGCLSLLLRILEQDERGNDSYYF